MLLFSNSEEVAKVIRRCSNQAWRFGYQDFQLSHGGSSSYVASYINSLVSIPLLYRSCSIFRPRSRASLGFFEKGKSCKDSDSDQDFHAKVQKTFDFCFNGRIFDLGKTTFRSTPPMSYIRTLLPRFSSAVNGDYISHIRIISACASAKRRTARYGFIDYDPDSVLSFVRSYVSYIFSLPLSAIPDEDVTILHQCRLLTALGSVGQSVDLDSFTFKLYSLFLCVNNFLKAWSLNDALLPQDLSRIITIYRIGFQMESDSNYNNLIDFYKFQESYGDPIPESLLYVPSSGMEQDFLDSNNHGEAKTIITQLHNRAVLHCSGMVKHKKLNDANKIFFLDVEL